MAEERSMIQISFRTQDLNIKTGTIWNVQQNSQLIHHPLFSRSVNPLDLPQKSTIRELFKAKSTKPKPNHSKNMAVLHPQKSKEVNSI